MSSGPVRTQSEPRLPIPGQPDTNDQLLAMVTALTAQLAVTRERLDTVERLAEAAGLFGPEQVDRYQPDEAALKARDALRTGLIARVFRPLQDAAVRTAKMLKGESE